MRTQRIQIQILVGFMSAGLGFAAELVLAARFGADARTDVYRWAGLMPFYAGSIINVVFLPVLFRDYVWTRLSRLSMLVQQGEHLRPSEWVYWLSLMATLFCIFCFGLSFFVKSLHDLSVAVSLAYALSLVSSGILLLPIYYGGHIFVFTALLALGNGSVLLCAMVPYFQVREIIQFGFGIPAIFQIAASLALLTRSSFRHLAPSEAHPHALLRGGGPLLPLILSNLANLLLTLMTFGAFSRAHAGVLSLYSLTQKVGLLASVPASALLSAHIRHQRSVISEGSSEVSEIVRMTIPILVAAPFLTIAADVLLCALYRVAPESHSGRLLTVGAAANIFLTVLTLASSMLVTSRSQAINTVVPSLLNIMFALAGPPLILRYSWSEWIIAFPPIAAGLAATINILWAARKSNKFPVDAFAITMLSFIGATVMISVLWSVPGQITLDWTTNTFSDLVHRLYQLGVLIAHPKS